MTYHMDAAEWEYDGRVREYTKQGWGIAEACRRVDQDYAAEQADRDQATLAALDDREFFKAVDRIERRQEP